jgi:amino-acid N-acetyltransferase
MHIFARPTESPVRALLTASHLPTDDLTAQHFEHFLGCGTPDAPVGVVGLELYGETALLRSLAVDDAARGTGCGKALVAAAEAHAQGHGVRQLYLITTTAEPFFAALGYERSARDVVPEAIRGTAQFAGLCPASAAVMTKSLPVH